VTDELDPLRKIRPDRLEPDDPGDPGAYTRAKDQLMSQITNDPVPAERIATPDLYPRLAYNDELAAVDFLSRVFGFVEAREARMEFDGKYLCWLRLGTGMIMVGRANPDVHQIHSPTNAGLTTVMLNVYVPDIDAHHAVASTEGADITMEIEDAFYGERRYEATDPEGHRWHFAERFDSILQRGGRTPSPGGEPS